MSDKNGLLIIKPKAAKLTRDTEFLGKMDPYCIIKLGDERFRTETHKNAGKFPSWREEFKFNRTFEMEVIIEIWDQDSWKSDDLVGSANIPLTTVFQNTTDADWFPLLYKGRSAGQLRVELKFEPLQHSNTQTVTNRPNSAVKYFTPMVATTVQRNPNIHSEQNSFPVHQTYHTQASRSYPSQAPQSYPSQAPQSYPSQAPQSYPSQAPQSYPSQAPQSYPSQAPQSYPSQAPQPYPPQSHVYVQSQQVPQPQMYRASTSNYNPNNPPISRISTLPLPPGYAPVMIQQAYPSQPYPPAYTSNMPQSNMTQGPYMHPQLTNPAMYLNYQGMQGHPSYPPPHR